MPRLAAHSWVRMRVSWAMSRDDSHHDRTTVCPLSKQVLPRFTLFSSTSSTTCDRADGMAKRDRAALEQFNGAAASAACARPRCRAAPPTCSTSASTRANEASPNTAMMMANSWLGHPAWSAGRSCLCAVMEGRGLSAPRPAAGCSLTPKTNLPIQFRSHSPQHYRQHSVQIVPQHMQRAGALGRRRHRPVKAAQSAFDACARQENHCVEGHEELQVAPRVLPPVDCGRVGRGGQRGCRR